MTCNCIRIKRMSIVIIEIVTGKKNKVMKNVVGSSEKRGKCICRGSLIERGGQPREPKIFDLHLLHPVQDDIRSYDHYFF